MANYPQIISGTLFLWSPAKVSINPNYNAASTRFHKNENYIKKKNVIKL